MHGRLAAGLLALILLAGCLGGSSPQARLPEGDALGPEGGTEVVPLALAGTGCRMGGGHSVHPRMLNPLPQPWVPADILADVGPQLVWSEVPDPFQPVPEEGNTIGNWHATMICDSWTHGNVSMPGLVVGFVGMRVERPEFGPEGAEREYLITVLSATDAGIVQALHHQGFHAVEGPGVVEEGAAGHWHTLLDGKEHGIYESRFAPKELGAAPEGVTRLWWQHDNGNQTWTPVALDLVTAGGTHLGAEGQGTFSHLGTGNHPPLPGIAGHTAALAYERFDAAFSWGPATNVSLEGVYVH